MQEILLGYAISGLFIGTVFVVSFLLYKVSKQTEYARKLVHIALGAWPFIGFYYFPNLWSLVSIPVFFVFANYMVKRYNLLPFMERTDSGLGTVWYALALSVVMAIGYVTGFHYISYISMLVLALGDGLAAVVGTMFAKNKLVIAGETFNKSRIGSCTVFFITAGISLTFYPTATFAVGLFVAIFLGCIAMALECFSTEGYDNLFLPFGIAMTLLALEQTAIFTVVVLAAATMLLLVGAYAKRSLQVNAVSTAYVAGMVIYVLGGGIPYLALIVFFVLGSVLSKVENQRKLVAEDLHAETGTRGVMQVLMNTMPAIIAMVVTRLLNFPEHLVQIFGLVAFAVSAADTFASEIGMLSKGRTISIITFQPVQQGMSGGVSLLGSVASVVGASCIALIGGVIFGGQAFIFILIMGVIGAIIDSIMGETLQVKYTGKSTTYTEQSDHTTVAKGIAFIDNNVVNILSNVATLVLALCFAYFA